MQYSNELITKLQKHLKTEHNKEITNEEANEYLESLADLYLTVTNNRNGKL